MSKEKQIEEMAKVLRPLALCSNCLSSLNRDKKRDGNCYRPIGYECSLDRDILKYCEALYNAGYRKQEWISVEDRLPDANAQVLAINSDGEFYVATYIEHKISPSARGYMTWASGMYNGKPTHWMPLPEAPKMKGGAE